MRALVLFDIDGTLVRGGPAKEAFHVAMVEAFGTAGDIQVHDFAGKTDPQIARELLLAAGLSDDDVDQDLPALWPVYVRELDAELSRPDHRTRVLPGVIELIAALEARREAVVLGLLTGNIEAGAARKLASAGLAGRFGPGAFGSDHERRDALPAIAVRRAAALTGAAFTGADVVIIGDTPHDVTCGRSLSVRAVAVATGRHEAAALTAAGAHCVLPDLADTDAALSALLA
jgi:phosphoglycolate phosphatase